MQITRATNISPKTKFMVINGMIKRGHDCGMVVALFHLYCSMKIAVHPWGMHSCHVGALFVVDHLRSRLKTQTKQERIKYLSKVILKKDW